MASKKKILKKIKIVLTGSFDKPQDAFNFFDKNSDGALSRKKIVALLKEAEISGFLRGLVASSLIGGYDFDDNEKVDWKEFKQAISEL